MTLNGVMALILCFFSLYSIALQADYVTVVEDVVAFIQSGGHKTK